MNCEKTSDYLPQLLAGALGRDQEMEVLSHLAGCRQCREELAMWAQVADVMQSEAEAVPGRLTKQVRDELFGRKAASVMEGIRVTRQALNLTRSACRLAFATAGIVK
jgi:hypothetical protein